MYIICIYKHMNAMYIGSLVRRVVQVPDAGGDGSGDGGGSTRYSVQVHVLLAVVLYYNCSSCLCCSGFFFL